MSYNSQNRRKDDELIGRIDERLKGLSGSFLNHEIDDRNRFELVFGHMKDSFDKLDKRFDKIDEKLNTLWDLKNSQAGIFSVSRLIGGGVWAAMVITVDFLMRKIWM